MNLISILIAVLSLNPGQSQSPSSTSLTIVVKNVKSDKGEVAVTLFNSKEGFLKKAFKHQSVDAAKGEIKFVFTDVPTGSYTAYALHDKNGNGNLDMNALGIPNEPYGMSKDGKNMFGPPNYEKSLFEVGESDTTIKIKVN